jgi:predicted SAM-dependent methyltransferase
VLDIETENTIASIERYTSDYTAYEEGWKRGTGARMFARRVATAALRPLEAKKAQQLLQNQKPLKLHLGCGDVYLEGWVNIDLVSPRRYRRDLRWNLQRGLPFPDGSAEAVFSEHLLEHLELAEGLAHLEMCRRVLAPGGVLRIGVPDLERYVQSYLGNDDLIDKQRPGRPTRGIAFVENFFFHGHKMMYDFETLELMLREANFASIEHSAFGQGRIAPPDSKFRQLETLYVEATKLK